MPTIRPRYTVTDTGELKELLDEAQARWPEVANRKDLLLLLADYGLKKVRSEAAERRLAVEETKGALSGVYRPGDLSALREDWPE